MPKVAFNHRRVPINMPEDIWITDTSFRDGQQSVNPYTPDQIVELFKMLSRLGGPYGLIRQTEFFIYSKRDREAIERCMDLGLRFPEITTWIRASREDFKAVRDLGIRETGILVSCSDYHIFKKLKMTRREAMEHYLATVKDAFEAGVEPRCHLEDITRADFYGFVVPFVNELMKLSQEAGIPVRIRACDTMGYGVPYTDLHAAVFVLRIEAPAVQHLVCHFGDTNDIFVCLGRQTEHIVELDAVPTALEGDSAGIQQIFLGDVFVDHVAQALATALYGKGQAALANLLQLFHELHREVVRAQRGEREADAPRFTVFQQAVAERG